MEKMTNHPIPPTPFPSDEGPHLAGAFVPVPVHAVPPRTPEGAVSGTNGRAGGGAAIRFALVLLAAIIAVVGLAAAVVPAPVAAAEGDPAPVWVTRVEGAVVPPLADYLVDTMQEAQDAGAQLLIIELDTPGGLDSSMREIIQAELDSEMAVGIYVYPQGARSASAGLYIMMAADVTAMAPQTNLGSATPVSLTGDMDEEMQKKVTNDAAAYIRGLATTHDRNAEWAEEAVREAVSLTAEEAKDQNVIEFVAEDLDDLLAQLDGYTTVPKGLTLNTEGAPLVEVSMSWREKLLHRLVDPNIIFILLLLGVYGIIFEFQNPGLGAPGIAGAISLLLAAYGLQILPVNYVGLLLLAVAVVLFVAEIKVQSSGILGLGGTIALVLGGLMLFNSPESAIRVDWTVLIIMAVLSAAFFGFIVTAVARAQRRRPETGSEGMAGEKGVARTTLDPSGQVSIHGEIWRAEAEEGVIEAGTPIRVVSMKGLKLTVASAAGGEGSRGDDRDGQDATQPTDD
jgi:membrane-bound serine protease (ClpP class)